MFVNRLQLSVLIKIKIESHVSFPVHEIDDWYKSLSLSCVFLLLFIDLDNSGKR